MKEKESGEQNFSESSKHSKSKIQDLKDTELQKVIELLNSKSEIAENILTPRKRDHRKKAKEIETTIQKAKNYQQDAKPTSNLIVVTPKENNLELVLE